MEFRRNPINVNLQNYADIELEGIQSELMTLRDNNCVKQLNGVCKISEEDCEGIEKDLKNIREEFERRRK